MRKICSRGNTKGYKYLKSIIDSDDDIIERDRADRHKINNPTKPGIGITYRLLNPDLSVQDMYKSSDVKKYKRILCIRLRLGAHYLAIETGRWSRRSPQERFVFMRRACSN